MTEVSVLVVDDDETDRYLLKRQLNRTQLVAQVHECRDGAEALEYFTEREEKGARSSEIYPPIVIFLDINMPGINGHDFLIKYDELRLKYKLDTVVVMMFSTSERQDDIKRALKYPFVHDYLVKGKFSQQEMTDKLLQQIQQIQPG